MAELFENYSLFDSPVYKLPKGKPIALIETFAGIGAQAKALERLGVPFVHHRVIEIDRFAIESYNAIHGTNFTTSTLMVLMNPVTESTVGMGVPQPSPPQAEEAIFRRCLMWSRRKPQTSRIGCGTSMGLNT